MTGRQQKRTEQSGKTKSDQAVKADKTIKTDNNIKTDTLTEQGNRTLGHRIDSLSDRILAKPVLFIFLFFLADMLIFGFLNSYPKTIAVYNDEMFYYHIARCIFEGKELTVRHFNLDFHKVLYSILLAPTFAIKDSIMRIRATAFLNSFIISLSVFPLFGTARKLLKKNSQVLAVMFIWLIFPAKVVGAGYMCEITNMLLTQVFVYLFIKGYYIRKDINRILMAVLLGIVQFLLYFNKEISIYFGIAYAIAMFTRVILDKEKRIVNFLSIPVFAGVAFGLNALVEKMFFSEVANSYEGSYQAISGTLSGGSSIGALLWVSYFLMYNLVFVVLGFGVFTVIVPILTIKRQDTRDRVITVFLAMAVLFAMGAVAFLINRGESTDGYSTRVHLRYVEPLIMPTLILFISVMSKYRAYIINNKNLIIIGHTLYFALFVCAGFTFEFGSMVDDTVIRLYQKAAYALDEISLQITGGNLFSLLLRICLVAAVAGVLALLYKKEKLFMPVAFALFAVAMFSNLVCSYTTFRRSYEMNRETVKLYDETADYLGALDGNILIASTDLYIQRGYDSFLDVDNLYSTSMRSVYINFCSTETSDTELVIDLDKDRIKANYPDYDDEYEDLDKISYVILKDDETIAFNADRIAGFPLEELGFSLYRQVDPSKLCLKFNAWDQMTDKEKQNYEFLKSLVQGMDTGE